MRKFGIVIVKFRAVFHAAFRLATLVCMLSAASLSAYAETEPKACEAALGINAIDFTGQSAEFVARFKELDRMVNPTDQGVLIRAILMNANKSMYGNSPMNSEVADFIEGNYKILTLQQLRLLINSPLLETYDLMDRVIRLNSDGLSVSEQMKLVELLITDLNTRDNYLIQILKTNWYRSKPNDFNVAYLSMHSPSAQLALIKSGLPRYVRRLSEGEINTLLQNAKSIDVRIEIQERLRGQSPLRRLSQQDVDSLIARLKSFRSEGAKTTSEIISAIRRRDEYIASRIPGYIERFLLLHGAELSDDQLLRIAWESGAFYGRQFLFKSIELGAGFRSFQDAYNLLGKYLYGQSESTKPKLNASFKIELGNTASALVEAYRSSMTAKELLEVLKQLGAEDPAQGYFLSSILLTLPKAFFSNLTPEVAQILLAALPSEIKSSVPRIMVADLGRSVQASQERLGWIKIRAVGGILPKKSVYDDGDAPSTWLEKFLGRN